MVLLAIGSKLTVVSLLYLPISLYYLAVEPELVYYLTCHVVLIYFHTVPVDETDELFMLSWLVDQHWLTLSFQQFISTT
jgi:hypothetical protein